MASETLHVNAADDQIHVPKGFSGSVKNDMVVKSEQGALLWEARAVLPPALNFVDGDSPPPTEAHGDIYVILDSSAVHSNWDGASDNDWLRYDTSADTWFSISPVEGLQCWDKTLSVFKGFDGTDWKIGGGNTVGVLEVKLDIVTADVLTLNSAPVTLIAAPGAGKAIELLSATFKMIYNSIAYATNTHLQLITDTAAISQFGISVVPLNTYLDNSADTWAKLFNNGGDDQDTSLVDNKAMIVFVPTGNPTAGNSDITIYATYRIINI